MKEVRGTQRAVRATAGVVKSSEIFENAFRKAGAFLTTPSARDARVHPSSLRRGFGTVLAVCLAFASQSGTAAQSQPDFATAVSPVLTTTCAQCHNDRLSSGGLNLSAMNSRDSILRNRETWEKILRRVQAGEMPPSTAAKLPDTASRAFIAAIQTEFDRADAAIKPDPGRVTARRLNRNEYSNTIRDLFGVDFRAEKYFPTDDSGDGFDNIGEVLSVSPVLMEKYLNAAERIARWAISTEIPPKQIVDEYHLRDRKIRRVDSSTVEAIHRVEYPGEYTVRFGLPDRKSTRLNSSHVSESRMPSSA